MKVTIIGPSAGGKSVLARKLCEEFSVPRLEIDRLWFTCGGEKCMNGCTVEQKTEINKKILASVEEFLANNQSWVIEGTYSKIQSSIASRADTVILIKRPLLFRILSHIARVLKGKDRHPEVTRMQDLGFVKTMIKRWRKGESEKINELASQFTDKVVVLRSFKEINQYFNSLNLKT